MVEEDKNKRDSGKPLCEGFAEEAKLDIAEQAAARASKLIPKISDDEIRWWEDRIAEAQRNPPEDKKLFVDSVNQILDTFHLRINTGDGQLYRLVLKPGRPPKGYIQLSGGPRRTRGIRGVPICLVRVPQNYAYAGLSKPSSYQIGETP